LHLGLAALRAGQDLWVASVVRRYTAFDVIVSQLGKRPHAAARWGDARALARRLAHSEL